MKKATKATSAPKVKQPKFGSPAWFAKYPKAASIAKRSAKKR